MVVARKDRYQLHLEGNAGNVARHGPKEAEVRHAYADPRRHRRCARGVSDQRIAESVEHRVDVEEALHVFAAQVEQLTHAGHHRSNNSCGTFSATASSSASCSDT